MNYNHTNKVFEYYRKKIFPALSHRFPTLSFDAYLQRFSFLPSGKWLRDFESVKVARHQVPIDPEKLIKKYKENCVSHFVPGKPEEGIVKVVYQLSPTLHFETSIWIWIEHETVQSYAYNIICYNNPEEYLDFIDDLWKIRKEGNTDDKPMPTGFLVGFQSDDKKTS